MYIQGALRNLELAPTSYVLTTQNKYRLALKQRDGCCSSVDVCRSAMDQYSFYPGNANDVLLKSTAIYNR